MSPDRPSTPAHTPQAAPACTPAQLAQLLGLRLEPGGAARIVLEGEGVTVDVDLRVRATVSDESRAEWIRRGLESLLRHPEDLTCSRCDRPTAGVTAERLRSSGVVMVKHVCVVHALYPSSPVVLQLGYALYTSEQLELARQAAAPRAGAR